MFLNIFLVWCLLINCIKGITHHPILIVVSYDAFRYDYIDNRNLPNMKRIRNMGTSADYMINVFPTKTFPNHHSIATGLFTESHGVIANYFLDPDTKEMINITCKSMYQYNPDVVPIWVHNENSGPGRYSGVMMWPGSHINYQNKSVTYLQNFQRNINFYKRIDMAMDWINHPNKPASLVMLYFEEPDYHSHPFGPNADITSRLIEEMDNVTLYLEKTIEENGLTDKVNVIHLSDHGMYPVTTSKIINIASLLPADNFKTAGSSPTMHITPTNPEDEEDIYQKLKSVSTNNHFKIYRKREYPERWHYTKNRRTPPIFLMADDGYAFEDLYRSIEKYEHQFKLNVTSTSEFGIHGYDVTTKEMRPFFMARGPRIRLRHKVKPFYTVDLFELFCDILEINPLPTNGSFSRIKDILNIPEIRSNMYSLVLTTAGGILAAILLIGCAAFITVMLIKRQQNITTTAALNKRFPQTFNSHIEAQHLLEPEEA